MEHKIEGLQGRVDQLEAAMMNMSEETKKEIQKLQTAMNKFMHTAEEIRKEFERINNGS